MGGVRSLAEFVDEVGRIRRAWRTEDYWIEPWFRGQRNADWPLVPNAWRNGDEFDLYTEFELRDEFERRGAQLMVGQRPPTNKWEWYFTIQHYRGRTRLLDWTDAALVALYFAIGQSELYCDAVVWALDPYWFNYYNFGGDSILNSSWDQASSYLPDLWEPSILPEMPAALDPPHVTARFSVQHSHFTLHGSKSLDLRDLTAADSSRLVPIRIKRSKITEVRRDLRVCGVVETSIYPDLEGLSRELSPEWEEVVPSKRNMSRKSKRWNERGTPPL